MQKWAALETVVTFLRMGGVGKNLNSGLASVGGVTTSGSMVVTGLRIGLANVGSALKEFGGSSRSRSGESGRGGRGGNDPAEHRPAHLCHALYGWPFCSLQRHFVCQDAVSALQALSCTARRGRRLSSVARDTNYVARPSQKIEWPTLNHMGPPFVVTAHHKDWPSHVRGNAHWSRIPTRKTALSCQGRDVSIGDKELYTLGAQIDEAAGETALDESIDLTVICFDIETSGFSARNDRIIEFAARDLAGGEGSTIETLVNPGKEVRNERVHNISSLMVNDPSVPTWKDVGPAILDFVESRRRGQGLAILVAHNGKRFDVPFIMTECHACGLSIPSSWRFADSLPLARLAMKGSGKNNPIPGTALSHLFTHYNLPSEGKAHRAMADVNMLAQVLQQLMKDLQMGKSELLAHSFSADEIILKPSVSSGVSSLETLETSETSAYGLEVADEAGTDRQNLVNTAKDSRAECAPWDLVSEECAGQRNEPAFENSLGSSFRGNAKSSGQHFKDESEAIVFPRANALELGSNAQITGLSAVRAGSAPKFYYRSRVLGSCIEIAKKADVERRFTVQEEWNLDDN